MNPDADLLARYVASKDAAAFAGLVERYLPLVYAAARRRTGDAALADDVAQAVFCVLAKKAGRLPGRQPLSDWLLTVTRYAAANAAKQQRRRARHEAAAARPEAVMPTADLAPDREAWTARLDAALDGLPVADRRAVVLRYYGDADYASVAAALGVSEAAARKRVTRAVRRLRTLFGRRGAAVSPAALAAGLPAALSTTPPPALAAAVTHAATHAGVATASVALLSKGTLHAMWITKLKVVAVAVASILLLAGTGVGLAVALAGPTPPPFGPVAPAAGWLKLELRGTPTQTPIVVYVEPATGRRVRMGTNDDPPVFTDPPARLAGVFDRAAGLYVVGPTDPHAAGGTTEPYTAAAVFAALDTPLGTAHANPATIMPGGDRVTDVALDLSKLPTEARLRTPPRVRIETDADGRLRRVVARPAVGGAAAEFDAITATPVAGPPFDLDRPERLPLPPGVTLVDDGPPAEARALLDRLDAIVREGAGLGTVAVVWRRADQFTGELRPDSDAVEICAGDARRFVIAQWAVSGGMTPPGEPTVARPQGWPKPTLEAVLNAVGDMRPNHFFVCDGTACWTDGPDATGRRTLGDPASVWRTQSVVGRLWGAAALPPVDPWTIYAVRPGPGPHDPRVTLDVQSRRPVGHGPTTRPTVDAFAVTKLTVSTQLGPYPMHIETDEATGSSDPLNHRRTVTDIEPAAWMFADPVRVPEHWRVLETVAGAPGERAYEEIGLTRYATLVPSIPAGRVTVPPAWFTDPATHWRR